MESRQLVEWGDIQRVLDEYFKDNPTDEARRRDLRRSCEHFLREDDLALDVLKGHLLVEEYLTRIIELYVNHASYLSQARLTISQKICLARSISFTQEENKMWGIILALNTLRNELAHTLDQPKLGTKLSQLRTAYFDVCPEERDKENSDRTILRDSILLCMGFLSAFEKEIQGFRWWINKLDRVLNKKENIVDVLRDIVQTKTTDDGASEDRRVDGDSALSQPRP